MKVLVLSLVGSVVGFGLSYAIYWMLRDTKWFR